MKTFATSLCLVLLTLLAASSKAQSKRSGKPQLFTNLPPSITLSELQLHNLFVLAKGQTAHLPINAASAFSGTVSSNVSKYDNLQTIIIKLPAYSNTLLSLSKQIENKTITFVGRIFNPQFEDGFELTKTQDGLYHLVKIATTNTLTDCSL